MNRFVAFLFLFAPISAFAADAHAPPAGRMTGWQAFSEIQNGNMRFYEGTLRHPAQNVSTRETLASGQKPHTIILSCSDSRLPPEIIFDQGLGDVFTVRLAGNVVNAEAIASIEYAIEHLGARLLLVMGHESCGAVGAAIASKAGVSNGSESLDVLVNKIRGNLTAGGVASAESDKTFRQPVKENVGANVKELLSRSSIVRQAIEKKGLILGQAIYSLKTGRVEFWDVGVQNAPAAAAAEAPVIVEQKVHEEEIRAATPPPARGKTRAKPAPAAAHHH